MDNEITLRAGTEADTPAVFRLFLRSIRDLAFRQGNHPVADGDDPDVIAKIWSQRQSMFDHLARTAHQFWVAERGAEMLGYARSIRRDGVLELTEFFVSPGAQSAGIGRELLRRAFDSDGVRFRTIIASTDIRAQALYIKAGVHPRFPIVHFRRRAEANGAGGDLRFEPISSSPAVLETLGQIDVTILGYRRDVDHHWLLADRDGYLIYRDDTPVGYGYVSRGTGSGPFALLDTADIPAALAQAETLAARGGQEEIVLATPAINRTAVDYLLGRGFRMDPSFMFYMSDKDEAALDRYILTSPPIIM